MVERELNYAHESPPWIPNEDGTPKDHDYVRLRAKVTEMRRHARSEEHVHYDETLAALDRMNSIAEAKG